MPTIDGPGSRKSWCCALAVAWLLVAAAGSAQETSTFAAATAAFEAGDYQRALRLFETARANGSDSPALHYNIGVCQYRVGDYAQAAATFAQVRDRFPQFAAVAEYNRGLALSALDDRDAARAAFARARASDDALAGLADAAIASLGPAEAARSRWVGYFDVAAGHDDNVALDLVWAGFLAHDPHATTHKRGERGPVGGDVRGVLASMGAVRHETPVGDLIKRSADGRRGVVEQFEQRVVLQQVDTTLAIVAVIDVAGYVASMKDHAVDHGFHVHDERHFVETYSLRQAWEVDLHPEEACSGPIDLHLSLDVDPRAMLGFEDEVMKLDDLDETPDVWFCHNREELESIVADGSIAFILAMEGGGPGKEIHVIQQPDQPPARLGRGGTRA